MGAPGPPVVQPRTDSALRPGPAGSSSEDSGPPRVPVHWRRRGQFPQSVSIEAEAAGGATDPALFGQPVAIRPESVCGVPKPPGLRWAPPHPHENRCSARAPPRPVACPHFFVLGCPSGRSSGTKTATLSITGDSIASLARNGTRASRGRHLRLHQASVLRPGEDHKLPTVRPVAGRCSRGRNRHHTFPKASSTPTALARLPKSGPEVRGGCTTPCVRTFSTWPFGESLITGERVRLSEHAPRTQGPG